MLDISGNISPSLTLFPLLTIHPSPFTLHLFRPPQSISWPIGNQKLTNPPNRTGRSPPRNPLPLGFFILRSRPEL